MDSIDITELAQLFMKLKERIDMTKKLATESKEQHKRFLEGVAEGRELTAYEVCEFFEELKRPEISKTCRSIFEFEDERELL